MKIIDLSRQCMECARDLRKMRKHDAKQANTVQILLTANIVVLLAYILQELTDNTVGLLAKIVQI